MDYPYPLVMKIDLCSVPQQSEIEYPFRARFLPSVLPEAVMGICNSINILAIFNIFISH